VFVADEAGNFYFVDRLKDAIRRRGENISSHEVEEEVNGHPAVLESAAVAVPAEIAEDEIKLVAVLKRGQSLSPTELLDYLQPRMSYHMVPRYVRSLEPSSPRRRRGRSRSTSSAPRERPTAGTVKRLATG
jgi:crotonobetaine/carnitine-CoA ligase